MKKYILTGAPGSGKTALLRKLEVEGYPVVEEAATDIIALWQAEGVEEPWLERSFIDAVVLLQKQREMSSTGPRGSVQFCDRSPVCTAALADYLGHPGSAPLACELERMRSEGIYERQVFFIRGLGFMTQTRARRINLEEASRFEKIHEEMYRRFDFEIVSIEAGAVADRVRVITDYVNALSRSAGAVSKERG